MYRRALILFALIALTVGLLPGTVGARTQKPASAAESSIPGLYAVNALVTTGSPRPTGLDLDPATGLLWVAEQENHKVIAYDHSGEKVESIEAEGSGPGQLNAPEDIEIANDEVFVVERLNHRVQVFDTAGNYLRMWGSQGSGPGQFFAPCGLAGVGHRMFVSDTRNDRIQVFNRVSGKYLDEFGASGDGDGQLDLSCSGAGLAIYAGELFVVDQNNHRIAVFSLAGDWQRHIDLGPNATPVDVHATPDGRIWVTDFDRNNVTIWSPSGTLLDSFGSFGQDLGEFDGPGGIVVDPNGDTVWVGELNNDRIQTFSTRRCKGLALTHIGTSYSDSFVTGAGADVVRLGAGDDTLDTGDGNDIVCAGDGADTVRLGPGDDFVNGEHHGDVLYGGPGTDTLRGAKGGDTLFGGLGADTLDGGFGIDTVNGQAGPDTISGDAGRDILDGGPGNDLIHGRRGGDDIAGGPGDDVIDGDFGNDTLSGNSGDDLLRGGPGTDVCRGNLGIDVAATCETVFGVP